MKTTILVLLASGVFLTSPHPAAAQKNDPFVKTIDTVKRATIAVACAAQTAPNSVNLASVEGSGFFVSSDGTFLTAAHVAHALYLPSPPRQKPCDIPVIYLPVEGWKEGTDISIVWFKIDKCYTDDALDLAKCRAVANPFTDTRFKTKLGVVSFETSTQKIGTAIAFTGFPLELIQPLTARATIAGYMGATGAPKPRQIVIDHNNWPGVSGGPVYLSNGKIIGLILLRGTNDATGLTFARSGQFLVDFLAAQDAK